MQQTHEPKNARPVECPHLRLGFHAVHLAGKECQFEEVTFELERSNHTGKVA